jgi:predicted transglutaminase-like cysteine proteinase
MSPIALVAGSLAAVAIWISAVLGAHATLLKLSHMSIGANALAPIAFVDFCIRKPNRCEGSREIRQVTLDDDLLEQLASAQRDVNRLITPISQPPDVPWQDDVTVGDCKGYALAKRTRLLDAGWPPSALLFAIAVLPDGQLHLVLVVVSDRGDLVLDNLQENVVHWDSLPYAWLKRSAPANPLYWQTIATVAELAEPATISAFRESDLNEPHGVNQRPGKPEVAARASTTNTNPTQASDAVHRLIRVLFHAPP